MPTHYLLLANVFAFLVSFRHGLFHQKSLLRVISRGLGFYLLHGLQSGYSILQMQRFAPQVDVNTQTLRFRTSPIEHIVCLLTTYF